MLKLRTRYRSWGRRQKLLFWGVMLVVCYSLVGFLAVPPIVKAVLERKLPEQLNRPVTIAALRMNPYTLSLTVEGFAVGQREGEGEMVGFDRLYLNLEGSSLFRRALILSRLTLEEPRLDIARLDAERFSFSDLLTAPEAPAPQPEPDQPAHFSINNIEISGGQLVFRDLPKGVTHRISDLVLAIPSVSNLPSRVETFVEPRFAAVVNGTPVSLAGGSKPFADSRTTGVTVQMTGINLPDYLAYIPNPTGLTLRSGLLDIDTRLSYQQFSNQASRLALTGTLTLRDLEVVDHTGTRYLRLPNTVFVLADSNLLNQEVRLAELNLEAPQLELVRRPDGALLPLALLMPATTESAGAPATPPEATAENPIKLTIDRLRLNRGEVTFNDQALGIPAVLALSGINLAVDGLSNIPGTVGNVDLELLLNRTGHIGAHGSLVLDPLSLKSALEIASLPLQAFQPYLAEQARVTLTGGQFNLQGEVALTAVAGAEPLLSFAGGSSIAGLATADNRSGADLLKWQQLQLRQINLTSRPLRLSIDEVRLDAPAAQVLVNDDGSLNLGTLVREPGSAAPDAPAAPAAELAEPAGSAAPPLVTIGRVVINEGSLQFRDRSIQPSYAAGLDRFSGTITGLSSEVGSQAGVDLTARVDRQAPLVISGALNPLSAEPFADVKLVFKDFNLTPLSPYTGKYLGRKTGKGKLNLDLHYQIAGKQLESSNQVFLDQFTLSETVDSPDATSLPVNLAIALLKDRSGEIHLDIPVAGDLDDPEFSVGGVIVQVIVNLIAKAATSPFALLGALIPEGEDIQHIPFEPGSAELGPDALDKLTTVAKVLHERPGLNMELDGRIDRTADSQALARARLAQLVRLQKLEAGGAKPKPPGQEDSVSAEEYPVYLEQAYQKALQAAPAETRKAEAAQQPATPEERRQRMEAFLLGTMSISDDDLRLLAIDRANAVADQLGTTGGVEAGRLFAVEPHLEVPEGDEGLASQALVQLLIK